MSSLRQLLYRVKEVIDMPYLIKQEEEEIGKMQEIGKIVRTGGEEEEEEIDKEISLLVEIGHKMGL